jgi:hypothetical protein
MALLTKNRELETRRQLRGPALGILHARLQRLKAHRRNVCSARSAGLGIRSHRPRRRHHGYHIFKRAI